MRQTKPPERWSFNRRQWRRIRHHSALLALSVLLVLLIAGSFTAPSLTRLSAATAYAGLLMLAVTLLLGPLNVLIRRPDPVSTDVRRDCGIWAAVLGTTHTVLALWGPAREAFWRAFTFAPERLLDSPGFANDVGLVATLLLVLLAALSNDRSLRALGRVRWKSVQRLSYVLFGAVVIHTLLYDRFAQPGQFYQTLLVLVVLVVGAMQANAWLERRAAHTRRIR